MIDGRSLLARHTRGLVERAGTKVVLDCFSVRSSSSIVKLVFVDLLSRYLECAVHLIGLMG